MAVNIRTEINPIRIGILSSYSKPSLWAFYISRFGTLEWTENLEVCEESLAKRPVDLLLVEQRRLPLDHIVWRCKSVRAVVSFEGWRGTLDPGEWEGYSRSMSHQEVGGVSDGHFRIFVAARKGLNVSQLFPKKPYAAAKLIHILDPLEKGKRVPLPGESEHPSGTNSEGLLFWRQRHGLISSPTVYSKVNWFQRKLSHKELASVLDLPPSLAKDAERFAELSSVMKVPGKIRVRVLEDVTEMMLAEGKRARSHEPVLPILKRLKTEAEMSQARPKVDFCPPVRMEESSVEEASARVATNTAKATKADDAEIPVFLWDDQVRRVTKTTVSDEKLRKACDAFRNHWMLPRWKRNMLRDFCRWYKIQDVEDLFHDEIDRQKSLCAGRKAIRYASMCSWWNWDGGSYPFFWRWEKDYQRDIRDGLAPRFMFEPPACFDRQKAHRDPEVRTKEKEKIQKVITRGYLQLVLIGFIKSLMHYFSVPKGPDIRMVYDGSKSGLNAALYCPWFAVPTSSSLERVVMPGTYQADNDFGDMFLNFQLHEELQKYTGVDV